tara:strand:+ start:241 stop:543 length:303 start_codon:yes stop_codon:yes gene_type:complete
MLDKIKNNYILLISSFLIIYFVSNLIGGERGLFSFFKKKNDLNHLITEKDKLLNEIEELKLNNYLITEKFDIDYIETLIRDKFVYGKKNEKIYIVIDKND